MYYMAMDGGGTKLLGLIFDENYRCVASARAEGTHLSVYPLDEVCRHVSECYEKLFAELPRQMRIERLYTICGDSGMFARLLPDGVTLCETHTINEAVSGLYAASGKRDGFVALSGTGSDVFCVKDGEWLDVIGGWGAILGDEGSGVWMSRQAMKAAIYAEGGRGPDTLFGRAVMEHYGFGSLWDYVNYLYATPSPFRRLGELLPLVARVADEGDELMLDVFRRGGLEMAEQMRALLRKYPDMAPEIVACGGAWKAHPLMAEVFCASVREEFPKANFSLPRFEHIMAGPVCHAIRTGEDVCVVMDRLEKNFPEFIWNAKGGRA